MGATKGDPYPSKSRRFIRQAAVVPMIAAVWAVTPAAAALVINEFLPDPSGSDGGREFVELLNTGPDPVTLADVRLQFANGAVGPEWATRWIGQAQAVLPAGGRFLIVDRNWLGAVPGDAEVALGLQNGPDAIRILQGVEVADLVGYGPLTDSGLFEGQPVAVVPGRALARRPDGRDTGDNGADLVAAVPTPGAPNFKAFSVALDGVVFDPPYLARPEASLRVAVTLRNDGTEPLPAGPCRLIWRGGEVVSRWDGAVADARRTLTFVLRPARRGAIALTWRYRVPAQADTIRVELGTVQVGAAALRLNEVLAVPAHGQGEWIEMQAADPAGVELSEYAVRDEDGSWVDLPDLRLAADQFVVVAEDSAALAGWWLANRSAGAAGCVDDAGLPRIRTLPRWPGLNNNVPADRSFADRVWLADSRGVVVDAVAWAGPDHAAPDRGLSLERIGPEPINPGAAHWMPCTALVGATPGCANSVSVPGPRSGAGDRLSASPLLLDRETAPASMHLQFGLSGTEAAWELRIFDLWGDLVRDFGGNAHGPGPRDLVWSGRDDRARLVAPGAYLAWLQVRDAAGVVLRREKLRLVVR